MKKHITLFCSLVATITCHQAYAQATQFGPGGAGHTAGGGATTHYVGWDNNSGINLEIRHDASRPITFHTGPSAGGTTPERMRITPSTGLVGIGLNSPQNRLHLHMSDAQSSVFSQWTTTLTGTAVTSGLRIGVNPSGTFPTAWYPFAEINQQEDAPMVFMTHNQERMRIIGRTNYFGSNQNEGYVGIGGIENPLSILHLSNGGTQIGGWRDWMHFGTLTNQDEDNMYVGLRSTPDGSIDPPFDAVINWGNNAGSPDERRSSLRFITTIRDASSSDGEPGSTDGQETMRITPFGLVGIGDFSDWPGSTNPNGSPTARLDVAPGGVRLRGLPNSSENGVLVTDSYGNVGINSNFTIGGITDADNGLLKPTTTPNRVELGGKLLHDTDIRMENFNLSLSGQGSAGQNSVMIGNSTLSSFNAKLEVDHNTGDVDETGLYVKTYGDESTGGRFEAGGFGVVGIADGSSAIPNNFERAGVMGRALSQEDYANNIGGWFDGGANNHDGPQGNYGVLASGIGGTISIGGIFQGFKLNQGGTTYGLRSQAHDNNNTSNLSTTNFGISTNTISNSTASTNYGVFAAANGPTGSVNYGVYATVNGNAINTAPVSGSPNFAGYFAGNLHHTGTITSTSDQILKQEITPLDSALYILSQLNPVSYKFKRSEYPQMNLASGKQYGLIAQEVQQVLPALVEETVHPAQIDSVGNILIPAVEYKSVSYLEFIPYLIKGMQQQQAQIDSLQATLAILTAPTGGTRLSSAQNTTVVELSNKAIVLDQNVPNPFAERTSIRFVLPDNYSSALMLFHDQGGRLVKSVQLTDKGEGHLDVYAQNLTDGVYTYTLVVDGNVIDSKRMVRQR